MVRDTALGASTTWADQARIFTLSVDASLLDGAIRVGLASRSAASDATELTGRALVIRRALEATTALDARFSAATFVGLRTRFGAETGNTSSRIAIAIGKAPRRSQGTSNLRITNRSGRAGALSHVIDNFANGAITAHVRNSTGICF